jgi:hypothetical protein
MIKLSGVHRTIKLNRRLAYPIFRLKFRETLRVIIARPAMIRESAFLSSKILDLLPQMLLLSRSLWWRAIVVIAGKPTAM